MSAPLSAAERGGFPQPPHGTRLRSARVRDCALRQLYRATVSGDAQPARHSPGVAPEQLRAAPHLPHTTACFATSTSISVPQRAQNSAPLDCSSRAAAMAGQAGAGWRGGVREGRDASRGASGRPRPRLVLRESAAVGCYAHTQAVCVHPGRTGAPKRPLTQQLQLSGKLATDPPDADHLPQQRLRTHPHQTNSPRISRPAPLSGGAAACRPEPLLGPSGPGLRPTENRRPSRHAHRG